jgi:hypothetical protein
MAYGSHAYMYNVPDLITEGTLLDGSSRFLQAYKRGSSSCLSTANGGGVWGMQSPGLQLMSGKVKLAVQSALREKT